VIQAAKGAGFSPLVIVVGYGADAVKKALGGNYLYALQRVQNGSGGAARAGMALLKDYQGPIAVLNGDGPLIRAEDLQLLKRGHKRGRAATLLACALEDPTGYGRLIWEQDRITGIVEEKDCSPEQKLLNETCTGYYVFEAEPLRKALARLRPDNTQGELYLTDVVRHLHSAGERVGAVWAESEECIRGVNTHVDLAEAEVILRWRKLEQLMFSGVRFDDPDSCDVSEEAQIAPGAWIRPHTLIYGGCVIGKGSEIGPWTMLSAAQVGENATVVASIVNESIIGDGASVGPFAHIRNGAVLQDSAQIGNFVEVKNSCIGKKAQAKHLAYIGDAEVGESANIGAGTITCNYDGVKKSRTKIGKDAFVGSNSTLVAPVEIGAGAYVGAASCVTKDVPADALAIGRARQENKQGWAKRRREAMRREGGKK
jgi:bifunctional UDP-N-acetylglucosamine pyrophosphorylase/glucosamine-1-phosphate N-acetyltransferase